MKLVGTYKLNVKKEIVWNALNDPEILKQCIPGCDSFDKENDKSFSASATNQIVPMNGTFSGAVKLSNIKKTRAIHYLVKVSHQLVLPMAALM